MSMMVTLATIPLCALDSQFSATTTSMMVTMAMGQGRAKMYEDTFHLLYIYMKKITLIDE